jgi:DNA polymerase-3 subunit delta
MAKKIKLPAIDLINNLIKQDKILPVYFLCGEDQFTIEATAQKLEDIYTNLVKSDFDKEIINIEKGVSLNQIIDTAYSFPFGGGKKILIIRNFELLSDKKEFASYVRNPADFTILIICNFGEVKDTLNEPVKSLIQNNLIFSAEIIKGDELVEWVLSQANEVGLPFTDDNARALIEISGDDKSMLKMQLRKFLDYAPTNGQLDYETIKNIASPTKQYSIFDLQNAVGRGDKKEALKVGLSLINSGEDLIAIVNFLAKSIIIISQMFEVVGVNGLSRNSYDIDSTNARKVGISYGYFMNLKKCRYLFDDKRLLNASEALLRTDLNIKTSSMEQNTILTMLVSEIIS